MKTTELMIGDWVISNKRGKNESVLASNNKIVEGILELNNGKKLSKKDKLRLHLLKGYLLTGRIMTENFN